MFSKIILIIINGILLQNSIETTVYGTEIKVIERAEDAFPLSIIHMNDFHARFEPVNYDSNTCNPAVEICIGGYARAVTVIKALIATRPNPIYLNAGDNFQGTLWYNIGRWNVTSYFLNMLPADAMTIGNHEFDNKIEGVVPFLDAINTPIVICNIDDSEEPDFQGKYQKSIVIEKYDRKIGVIGVILSTTNTIAATGNLKFLNESQSILEEAAKLKAEGVDIIIVLSHCGLNVDKEIARICGDEIDVIVGGHSHTLMFNGTVPGNFSAYDYYPATVNGVLIVQASAYTKFIGDLTVYFDEFGKIINYEGAPFFLDTNIAEDPEIVQELAPWKEVIDKESLRYIGSSTVTLQQGGCYNEECSMGSFLADSYVNYFIDDAENDDEWTLATMAIINAGGIRTTLVAGDLNFGKLMEVTPFENTLDIIELEGKYLQAALERAAGSLLQLSGIKVVYNLRNPIGNRLVSVNVLCNKCDTPEYRPLQPDEIYKIIVPSFLADGGSGYTMFVENRISHKVGPTDINAFVSYVEKHSPIISGTNGRITFV